MTAKKKKLMHHIGARHSQDTITYPVSVFIAYEEDKDCGVVCDVTQLLKKLPGLFFVFALACAYI